MHLRKPSQLFVAVAGALLLAEAGTVLLAMQVGFGRVDGWLLGLAVVASLVWTFLLAAVLAGWAQHLLLRGVDAACERLERARSSAHVELLTAMPTLDLLGRTLRRQESTLDELRAALLSGAVRGRSGTPVIDGTRLARAAGLAAGAWRTNADGVRLCETLEEWLVAVRARQEDVRERTAEVRATLERLPAPVIAEAEAGDPVIGYSVAAEAPAAEGDDWATLPPALRARLRGSAPWSEDDAAGPGRN